MRFLQAGSWKTQQCSNRDQLKLDFTQLSIKETLGAALAMIKIFCRAKKELGLCFTKDSSGSERLLATALLEGLVRQQISWQVEPRFSARDYILASLLRLEALSSGIEKAKFSIRNHMRIFKRLISTTSRVLTSKEKCVQELPKLVE